MILDIAIALGIISSLFFVSKSIAERVYFYLNTSSIDSD